MKSNKFELFMGHLGNGTTVCNKAAMEHGDYKTIAHISPAGNIKLYVNPDYIPANDMKRIEAAADRDRAEFLRRLKLEVEANPNEAYFKMLDALPIDVLLSYLADKEGTLRERNRKLINLYLENS